MEEIQLNEYIRTVGGYIGKIIDFYDGVYTAKFQKDNLELYIVDILKHSFNLTDLIEVGDYVNGCLITEINKDIFVKNQINLWTNMLLSEGEPFPNEYYKAKILEKDIKSIVTKEQFNQIAYKVKE